MFKTLARLLPRGFAWLIPRGGVLQALLKAVAAVGEQYRDFVDKVWLNIFPDTTDQLDEYEQQFALFDDPSLSDAERRQRIAARWAALGGQSPAYIRETLVAGGFPQLFVHEWFEPDTDPPVARSPLVSIGETDAQFGVSSFGAGGQFGGVVPAAPIARGFVLVNNRLNDPRYTVRESVTPSTGPSFGAAAFGTGAQFGGLGGAPQDVRPYYLYIGAETFGDVATVPANKRRELIALLLKICPAHLWLILIVEFD